MDRIYEEIVTIRYWKSLQKEPMTDDEAATKFVDEGLAKKYFDIWYEGITRKELRDKLFKVPKRYKYCLEDRIINVREHPSEDEYIANTYPDGREVYVKRGDYDSDGTRDGITFYKLRNRIW